MSGVNISILEGGKAENFGQVTKLRTSNGSDHDLWVPKGDVETKHLSVKKNGLYYTNQYEPTASEKKDGKAYDIYGWDTITVSVKKKVSGKKRKTKPDGTEIDVPTTVEVDDDGNLVEKELPTSIEIQVPPNKLQYYDGESISKTGMIVKAYYADDTEWGTVPLDEITIEPPTASGQGGSSEEYSDGDGVNAIKVTANLLYTETRAGVVSYGKYSNTHVGDYMVGTNTYEGAEPPDTEFYLTKYNGSVYIAFVAGAYGTLSACRMIDGEISRVSSTARAGYHQFEDSAFAKEYFSDVPESTKLPSSISGLTPATSGSQTITVKWTPDGGEDELTDTFDIAVVPHN